MNKKNLLNLLKDVNQEPNNETNILLIDSLNLFFRNFAVINSLNDKGNHIGGLGGFLRSLGFLIKEINPSQIYLVFDGENSSLNRKNIIPEYKSGRANIRINSNGLFDDKDEEIESQIGQISRLFQYLKVLPVKTLLLEKSEADDIIAYLASDLSKDLDNKIYIVSNDRDYLQLVKPNIICYRPTEKIYYTPDMIKEEFGVLPENFILYKTLLGDSSDALHGIKGLGKKKILKLFPLLSEKILSLDDIFDICEQNIGKHVIYSLIIQNFNNLEKSFKLMDLSNPMIDQEGIEYIHESVKLKTPSLNTGVFDKLQREDNLDKIIRNPGEWVKVFMNLK
jgi:DNA polymerase I